MKPPTISTITLTQPWASLIAIGAKCIETRGWYPRTLRPGSRIAIHAAKGWPQDARWLCTQEPFRTALRAAYRAGYFPFMQTPDSRNLPRGCVVALARYVKAVSTNRLNGRDLTEEEIAFGNYEPDRYAWFLEDVRPIEPVSVPGKLGIWQWAPPDWMTYLELKPPVLPAPTEALAPIAAPSSTPSSAPFLAEVQRGLMRWRRGLFDDYEQQRKVGAGRAPCG